ncbi:hypothetical protein ANTRET_LOCUS461 [Anthophora retusa]
MNDVQSDLGWEQFFSSKVGKAVVPCCPPFEGSINPGDLFNIDDPCGFWAEISETSSLPVDELIRRLDSPLAIPSTSQGCWGTPPREPVAFVTRSLCLVTRKPRQMEIRALSPGYQHWRP